MAIRMSQLSAVAAAIAVCLCAAMAYAQIDDKPLNENWAPTEWGADDKVGAANRTTPGIVLNAIKLVKQGKVATLGKLYAQDVPLFGPRSWSMTIPGTPTGGSLRQEQPGLPRRNGDH